MGDALIDLEHVLRSRKEKLTIQEANVMLAWRAQVMRDFTVGFGGGSVVTWLATPRINKYIRFNLTLGAAVVCGLWNFSRSVESSVERILALEGSWIQRELANILLKKYSYDPLVLQRLSKHFYSEEVYEDSKGDKPVFRWRFRNFSGERVDHSQNASSTEEIVAKKNEVKKNTDNHNEIFASKSAELNVNAAGVIVEDPFAIMFEIPGSAENNIPGADATSTVSARETRRERRSRRRHRRHHREDSDV